MAFDENKISVALDSWRDLSEKYPDSEQAKIVKDRIQELAEIVGESAKESIENAVALSYLRHGDFWSRGKTNIFMIDSSWIPNVESAIKWYDKVINEFPKSAASRVAYQGKMRTLLGWEESGRYASKHGIKESFDKYIPQLLETFSSFEKEHPNASTLQAFRYQIAQAYWSNKNWVKTREWLNLVIKKSGEGDSFYKDLAERRLKKVEY
jgi:tetratricopeptide (TPR) repeat protein